MTATDTLTATWTKHEGEWAVTIPTELATTLVDEVDPQVTVVNRRGESKVVRVLTPVDSKPWGQVWCLAPKEKSESVSEGYYYASGEVYKVRTSKAGNAYATILTKVETRRNGTIPAATRAKWVYSPGAISRLTAADRITVEQAAQYGHLHGFCAICGKTLTDTASVQRGIGPVCAKRI